MADEDRPNEENSLQALDQLSSDAALSRRRWSTTTAALHSIEKDLASIPSTTLRSSGEANEQGLLRFPDEHNSNFKWFLSLQDSFKSNYSVQLLTFLRRIVTALSSKASEEERHQFDEWISHALYLMQGCLLLHEASRSTFSRRPSMLSITVFLDPTYPDTVQIEAIQTIVSALVDRPDNFRMFEDVGGLQDISTLFLLPSTGHRVKVKLLEFLYFYLMPEPDLPGLHDTESVSSVRRPINSVASSVVVRKHTRQPAEHDDPVLSTAPTGSMRRTTHEKQLMLGRYFNNIDALVKDLNEFKPFGEF